MDRPEDLAQKIFGARAARYVTSATHADPVVLARVIELSRARRRWRVLDIATGAGHTALAMAPHVARVTAIDLTPQMLAEAVRLRDQRRLTNVQFARADVHHLSFRSACFDAVTCRRAPHHFSDIRRALGEIRDVLRPGGRLVIDDRSVPEDDFVDRCMNELDRYHDPSHVREYRPSEWRDLLVAAGFAVETMEPYTQHRPLTALTDGVPPENVAKMQAMLRDWSPAQCAAFNLVEVGGQPHLTHWYVMIGATRR